MTRRTIGKAMRVRIFLAAEGKCHLCSLRIDALKQPWEVEHVRPLSMQGADDESNMRPAHVECHAIKSAAEAGPRAKADRNAAKHLGIRPPSRLKGAGFKPVSPQLSATRPVNKWRGFS